MGALGVIGALLSVAGTAVSMSSAASSRRAMNRQVVQQLEQQKRYQAETSKIYEESMANQGNVAGRMAKAATTSMEGYRKTGSSPSHSRLPVDEARLEGQVGQIRDANAQREGQTEALFQNNLDQAEASRKMSVLGGLSSNSAGLSPILTQLAGNKSADAAAMGSLMSSAGTLAAIYGNVQKPAKPKVQLN